ncbi:MAG: hypothetical protein ACP5QR_05875 [Rhizomicrobium sp.]
MPRTLAQWVGIVVTTITVLGARDDFALAVALGVMAGGLATFFVALDAQYRQQRATQQETSLPRQ